MTSNWVIEAEKNAERVRKVAEQELIRLKTDFPTWPKEDVRRWAVARFPTIFFVPVLGLYLLRTTLNEVAWWKQYSQDGGQALIERGRQAFDRHLKGKLILDLVANVEHPFRLILKQLDPANKANDFSSIYNSLLRTNNPYLHSIPYDWGNTLELLRQIRNTVHNSWIYSPESGTNRSITFKGKVYNLTVGKQLDFIGWDFMVQLSEEVLRIVVAVARDPKVVALPPLPDIGAGEPID